LREKAEELTRREALAKTPEEIVALILEAAELKQQLLKISGAIHTGNPALHLRLVTDTEKDAQDQHREARCLVIA
jgi:hypothetical protein